MKKFFKTIFPVFFSILISVFLYKKINYNQLLEVLANTKITILILGTLISPLLAVIGGLRFSYFSKYFKIVPSPSFKTAFKSYLLASTFNIILPSKLGDLSKVYYVKNWIRKNIRSNYLYFQFMRKSVIYLHYYVYHYFFI